MKTQTQLPRVLLADDHPAMLAQTARVLEGGYEIVGKVGNGSDLIEAAARLDPDVVVLDITMPGVDGIEAARRLHRDGCHAKLVFLTVHNDPDYLRAALDEGAAAYVVKARLALDLIPALDAVLAGERFISPTLSTGDKP